MNVDQQQVWSECLSVLSRRMSKQSFFTWLKPTTAIDSNDGTFHIGVPNKFVATWLEEHYIDLMVEALRTVTERDWNLRMVVKPTASRQTDIFAPIESTQSNSKPQAIPATSSSSAAVPSTSFSTRYRFDNFVVGDSNEFAYAASLAVAKSPGTGRYNPLFIYGGVGLGKTHLAQAIGAQVVQVHETAQIIYVTSEKFTNDFIGSISAKSVADFASRYRSVDMLIIDDIQFFTGKESTQEQFFHTFNTLYQNGKQIVLTADRPPRDIRGLEERLLSRFQWGLVTDIQPPSLETRIAILQNKSEEDGTDVPLDVLSFIAHSVTTNIRELEGCLTRLIAYASLRGADITVDLAQRVLRDSLPQRKKILSIEQIQKRVAEFYNVSPEQMCSKRKTADIAFARQVAMYLCRTLTPTSLKVIGTFFGGRDHSTVIHAHKTVLQLMNKDVNVKLKIDHLADSLRA
jgi:chromosomal replication initiator protein